MIKFYLMRLGCKTTKRDMNFKKNIPLIFCLCSLFTAVSAQQSNQAFSKTDTLKTIEEVIVIATQSKIKGSNVNTMTENQINAINTGRDLPILLQQLPNVITTSDAGNGIGYTGIRVRGSDATRTNVTINGVPINDAESQGTFWVNMPDLASSAGNITLQRGLGSSMSGAGAFGACAFGGAAGVVRPAAARPRPGLRVLRDARGRPPHRLRQPRPQRQRGLVGRRAEFLQR